MKTINVISNILALSLFVSCYFDTPRNNPNDPRSTNSGSLPVSGSPPDAPGGVTAALGKNQVLVSWSSVSGATSYNIYWSIASGVTAANGNRIAGVSRPYKHIGLNNGTAYYYIVTAVNDYGESTESAMVSATPSASAAVYDSSKWDQCKWF